ncbi:uncharacterized protein [Rutidosis leptorrhynchoides]|uniref:uncharacterized protein n=1 Tax=Rutidosis leptorrhynchoides TaxID=125765 RepID=UPI003A995D89
MVCNDDELFASVDVSNMNISVSHLNGTHAKIVKDLVINKVVGIGDEHDDLYMFKKSVLGISNNSSSCTMKLWHSILGHHASQNQFNANVKVIRSDNGTKFVNTRMNVFCNSNGITHQTTIAYTPQQNGVAERKHRHLLNVARSLILQSSVLSGRSPFELVYQHKPNLSHLRVFGCLCFSTVLNNHDKFSSRAEKCVFIGYSSEKKGYKLLSLESKSVFYSRDVKFYETIFPFKQKDYTIVSANDINHLNFFDQVFVESQNTNTQSTNDEGREYEISDGTECDSSSDTICETDDNALDATLDDIASNDTSSPEGNVQNQTNINVDNQTNLGETSELRRSSRPTRIPTKFNDYVLNANAKYEINKVMCYANLSSENLNFVSNLNKSVEPTCYFEACLDKNWVDAMNSEIDALMRNNT